MCWPQPAQVVLPQVLHATGRHTVVLPSVFGASVLGARCSVLVLASAVRPAARASSMFAECDLSTAGENEANATLENEATDRAA
jgi:hypothetical protein